MIHNAEAYLNSDKIHTLKTHTRTLFLVIVLYLLSCDKQIKFNKAKWSEKTDPVFPSYYRAKMLRDLVQNYKLTGLSCAQLRERLGNADYIDSNSVHYRISVDYGGDIDPVYTKDLVFTYSKDSLITEFKVMEWKK